MTYTTGIEGVTGVRPIGARLQIGIKGPRGAPVEKDRFHLMEMVSDGKIRRGHPDFEFFNRSDPSKRRSVSLILEAPSWDDPEAGALRQGLVAYKIRGLSPRDRRPACVGDGRSALRWSDREGKRVAFRCLFDACPQRARERNGRSIPLECRTMSRLVGRLDWTGTPAEGKAPTPLVLFESGGIHTYRSLLGLREDLDRAARAFGIDPSDVPPWGLRIRLTVTTKTNPTKGTRFPVVVASLIDSAQDHVARVLQSRGEILKLAESVRYPAIDEGESFRTISGPVLDAREE